ncbi:hypothetical protein B0J12DRAFT_333683 [Macrophomina phaseolina]|uniref:Uncharacterized protein n=1 Tax=Macrophomina phaseolina TaxID=35725 RepID=A0ABQ8GLB4_9PEZI|nr:hypothetical protein B0J12DRAFT_333683 [Macrophomina phaseolina]
MGDGYPPHRGTAPAACPRRNAHHLQSRSRLRCAALFAALDAAVQIDRASTTPRDQLAARMLSARSCERVFSRRPSAKSSPDLCHATRLPNRCQQLRASCTAALMSSLPSFAPCFSRFPEVHAASQCPVCPSCPSSPTPQPQAPRRPTPTTISIRRMHVLNCFESYVRNAQHALGPETASRSKYTDTTPIPSKAPSSQLNLVSSLQYTTPDVKPFVFSIRAPSIPRALGTVVTLNPLSNEPTGVPYIPPTPKTPA